MEITTTTVERKRTLGFGTKRKTEAVKDPSGRDAFAEYDVADMPAAQHRCEACGEPATTSCTDAVELFDGGWIESRERYGCSAHGVKPMIHFLDGTQTSAQEYFAGCRAEQK
jgi:hypothetical protein